MRLPFQGHLSQLDEQLGEEESPWSSSLNICKDEVFITILSSMDSLFSLLLVF